MDEQEIKRRINLVKEGGSCGVWLGYIILLFGIFLPFILPLGVYLVYSGRYVHLFKGPRMKVFLTINTILNLFAIGGILTIITFIGHVRGLNAYNVLDKNLEGVTSEPGPILRPGDIIAMSIIVILTIVIWSLIITSHSSG